jgi:hypothetical protein
MKALKDEHRAEMEKHRQEIEQWEKDNGIPSGYLFGPGGHGKGHVVRMMHKPF